MGFLRNKGKRNISSENTLLNGALITGILTFLGGPAGTILGAAGTVAATAAETKKQDKRNEYLENAIDKYRYLPFDEMMKVRKEDEKKLDEFFNDAKILVAKEITLNGTIDFFTKSFSSKGYIVTWQPLDGHYAWKYMGGNPDLPRYKVYIKDPASDWSDIIYLQEQKEGSHKYISFEASFVGRSEKARHDAKYENWPEEAKIMYERDVSAYERETRARTSH